MSLVSVAMYVTSEPLADATAELWSFLRHYLSNADLRSLPEKLDWTVPYDEAWLRPDLLLSQACDYPFAKSLRGRVRLVATPVYDHPGCDGPLMRSFIVVRKDSPVCSLEDLRGTTAAINSPDSNSGSNFFRAAVAPLAGSGRFFGRIVETGSHRGSIAAVVEGRRRVPPSIASPVLIFGASIPAIAKRFASSPKRPTARVCHSSPQAMHRTRESCSCEMGLAPRSRSHRWPLIFRCFPKPTMRRSYHWQATPCHEGELEFSEFLSVPRDDGGTNRQFPIAAMMPISTVNLGP
ncbi:hypothetical protein LPU83_pLPU83b_0427 (plasmid) [Rhizobium favelukesii]|uniref:Phosphate ABC transporter substrate-binding protein n=1 Tax=Rhizobium favelukesii TaxID=348824 RepID=W6RGT0_9HYPH|nr:hypothetical protein LPU83_pLPU83b_0427 [Rhizobium favelukesii]